MALTLKDKTSLVLDTQHANKHVTPLSPFSASLNDVEASDMTSLCWSPTEPRPGPTPKLGRRLGCSAYNGRSADCVAWQHDGRAAKIDRLAQLHACTC